MNKKKCNMGRGAAPGSAPKVGPNATRSDSFGVRLGATPSALFFGRGEAG